MWFNWYDRKPFDIGRSLGRRGVSYARYLDWESSEAWLDFWRGWQQGKAERKE